MMLEDKIKEIAERMHCSEMSLAERVAELEAYAADPEAPHNNWINGVPPWRQE